MTFYKLPTHPVSRLVKTNEVLIFKPIGDIFRFRFLDRVNLNILKMDSDWLPEYKCHVINQSEMLLERQ